MGFLSAIPYLVYFLAINIAGFIADRVRYAGWLSTINVRRLAMIIGELKHLLLYRIILALFSWIQHLRLVVFRLAGSPDFSCCERLQREMNW